MGYNGKKYLEYQESLLDGLEPAKGSLPRKEDNRLKDYWQAQEEASKLEQSWSEEDKKRAYDSLNNRHIGND